MEPRFFFSALLLVIGLGLLFATIRALVFAWASVGWPKLPGVIRAVGIEHDEDGGWYAVSVAYAYWIDGHEIPASNVRFGTAPYFRKRSTAERYLQRYRPGQAHAIHVDPKAPMRSVLIPGLSATVLSGPAMACLLICLSGATVLRVNT